MWIQIMQVSALKKILVQSYGALKFWIMVMQFEIFHEKLQISWNWENEELGLENKFAERFGRQHSSGSCAARNIQDFGGATHMLYGWWVCMMFGDEVF